MSLPPSDRAKLHQLSRSDVETTAASLRQFLSKSKWLGKTNRYNEKTIQRINDDAPILGVRARNLAKYITASAVLHNADGWSYLARSASALLGGDPHRALHLAYYAE